MNLDTCLAERDAGMLMIAPHPDDESLAAGGLIQRALARGARVDVAFVTDGDNNPWPQRLLEQRIWVGARERERWGQRRRNEALRALHELGADGVALHRLGWPDGGVTWKLVGDTRVAIAQLRALVDQARPTLLVLPDIADRHPDHSALHVLMELVLNELPPQRRPQCLGYLLHGRARRDDPDRIAFKLTPQEQARKRAAVLAHGSQIALARRRLLRFAGAFENFAADIGNHGLSGARLPWRPPHGLRLAMRLLVVDAEGGQRLKPGDGDGATSLLWRDGTVAAPMPRSARAPYYVKLYATFPSPWVFDHWGWCRFVE